jgi:hypothetical protein
MSSSKTDSEPRCVDGIVEFGSSTDFLDRTDKLHVNALRLSERQCLTATVS